MKYYLYVTRIGSKALRLTWYQYKDSVGPFFSLAEARAFITFWQK